MSRRKELHDVELCFHRDSRPGSPEEGALLCSEDGDTGKTFWLPKSQIEFEIKGTTVQVTLPLWLAQEKKLAGF